MNRPLENVKVIDLSNMLMGPYTTQILGDMGADVIKVEAPGGDPVRGIGPFRNPGMGAIFLNCNRSKRSIQLDLKKPEGLATLLDLLKDADIFVYNRRPQVMERLGLSYEMISELNPRIIYAGLYGYGQGGPYEKKPAFDDLIQGAVSIPWLSHMADGSDPAYTPTAIVDRGVGLWAVGQILGALFHQSRTGKGQKLDMPMFEMMASFVLADHMAGATFEPSEGPLGYARMLNPHRRPFRSKDGYVCAMVYTDKHWQAFFKALGQEETMTSDPRFLNMTTRTENIASIYADLSNIMKTRTTDEWIALFDEADIPAMRLQSPDDLLEDPHLQATGFFSVIDHPSEGRLRDMAYPATWSETQPSPSRPAPRLSEHSAEILREIGYDDARIKALADTGVTLKAE
ncbi:CaiB/BaiF CoA transferase family protein [Sneathiella chinensis]|uniref:CoA transferase n=1 Tax=Sneathiella chinensis TaxID=349750 RepID=A0ABQ5TZP4_9PROT|nr:CoA transferase [Sneathiella chinensis]GLQ05084.1 CoA transferase [Sneathiella chinensis]